MTTTMNISNNVSQSYNSTSYRLCSKMDEKPFHYIKLSFFIQYKKEIKRKIFIKNQHNLYKNKNFKYHK